MKDFLQSIGNQDKASKQPNCKMDGQGRVKLSKDHYYNSKMKINFVPGWLAAVLRVLAW